MKILISSHIFIERNEIDWDTACDRKQIRQIKFFVSELLQESIVIKRTAEAEHKYYHL